MNKYLVKHAASEAQHKAGNYKKWHIRRDGMAISIENRKGAVRSGTSPDGTKWSNKMNHHYGYIRGTLGNDKDQVDVFINPGSDEGRSVYIVNQTNGDGSFDEHKVMMGFDSKDAAEKGYLSNYDKGWDKYHSIIEMPMVKFKKWVFDGRKTKMAEEYIEKVSELSDITYNRMVKRALDKYLESN